MPEFHVSWAALGASAAIATLLFAVYKHKDGKRDTARDREHRLQTLEGKHLKKGNLHLTIDTIEFYETETTGYLLRRLLLGSLGGTTYITLRLHNIILPDEVWDEGLLPVFLDDWAFDSDCVNSTPEPAAPSTVIVFEVETGDYEQVKEYLTTFIRFLNRLEANGHIGIQPQY